jgi:hypothetical protein
VNQERDQVLVGPGCIIYILSASFSVEITTGKHFDGEVTFDQLCPNTELETVTNKT